MIKTITATYFILKSSIHWTARYHLLARRWLFQDGGKEKCYRNCLFDPLPVDLYRQSVESARRKQPTSPIETLTVISCYIYSRRMFINLLRRWIKNFVGFYLFISLYKYARDYLHAADIVNNKAIMCESVSEKKATTTTSTKWKNFFSLKDKQNHVTFYGWFNRNDSKLSFVT